jgi:hypothetical protein
MIFTNPASAILMPIALGTAVGFGTRRELVHGPFGNIKVVFC